MGTTYHVTTGGSTAANGLTQATAWDLAGALAGTGNASGLKAGGGADDVILLHGLAASSGGTTYSPTTQFLPKIGGTSGHPLIIKNAPGELVKIDSKNITPSYAALFRFDAAVCDNTAGPTPGVTGYPTSGFSQYLHFVADAGGASGVGFEIFDSINPKPSSAGIGFQRVAFLGFGSIGIRVLGLYVHDIGGGLSVLGADSYCASNINPLGAAAAAAEGGVALDWEVADNVIQYMGKIGNGWDGHALYPESWLRSPRFLKFVDNITIHCADSPIHAYSHTPDTELSNVIMIGGIAFGSSTTSGVFGSTAPRPDAIFGGEVHQLVGHQFTDHIIYSPSTRSAEQVFLGFAASMNDMAFKRNHIVGLVNFTKFSLPGLNVVGGAGGDENYFSDATDPVYCSGVGTGCNTTTLKGTWPSPANFYYGSAKQPDFVRVRASAYIAGRGTVGILNYNALASTVNVNLSPILSVGDPYEIRFAANYGVVAQSGTYAGGNVAFTMTGLTNATPLGGESAPATYGSPAQFAAFVVLRTGAGTNVTVLPPVSGAAAAMLAPTLAHGSVISFFLPATASASAPPPALNLVSPEPPIRTQAFSIAGATPEEDLELASVRISLAYSGACTFTPDITVEQVRADSGAGLPVSYDIALIFDTSLMDAIMAPVRWTRPRLLFEGAEVVLGRVGTLQASRNMSSELQSMDFGTIGPLWTMSTIEPDARITDPCPPLITVGPGGASPLAWGNKLVELYLGFSKEKGVVKEVKVFQGRTYQKSSSRDTGIVAQFSAVDESILYAKLPICYELPPFAGKRRGEIVKDLAAAVGIDPAQVIVPVGKEVTKPLLLSNEHLLPFLDEFGAPENWLSYFDEFGRLVVEEIELSDTAHWTYDASRGDYELDSFKETLPSGPPTRYYVTGTQPVSGTGPGGSDLDVTSKTTEELQQLYAPQAYKVRPSGGPSYLYADGSYRSIPAQELMVVSRRTDFSTTRNGTPIASREVLEGFYNPKAADHNFNFSPPQTNWQAAYGNKTFHRDEVEPFLTIEESSTEGQFDLFGTLQRQVKKTFGWYSPRHALLYSPIGDLQSFPGVAWVYPGGVMRVDAVEQFLETQRIEQEYAYAADGTLFETVETTSEWFSPQSRADIVAVIVDPLVPPIPILDSPPLTNPPPPAPGPTGLPWQPMITGPSRRDRNTFYFDISFGNAPALGSVTGAVTTPAAWLIGPPSMNVSSSARVDQGNGLTAFQNGTGNSVAAITFGDLFPKTITQRYKVILAVTTKPAGFQSAFVELVATIASGPEAGTFKSNRLQFDPWAGLPPGADLTRA